jgi:hypothetical protein
MGIIAARIGLACAAVQEVSRQLASLKKGCYMHCRVQVLEKRIQDHSSVTSEKLAQLESKLRADPRLLPAIKAKMV